MLLCSDENLPNIYESSSLPKSRLVCSEYVAFFPSNRRTNKSIGAKPTHSPIRNEIWLRSRRRRRCRSESTTAFLQNIASGSRNRGVPGGELGELWRGGPKETAFPE